MKRLGDVFFDGAFGRCGLTRDLFLRESRNTAKHEDAACLFWQRRDHLGQKPQFIAPDDFVLRGDGVERNLQSVDVGDSIDRHHALTS